MTGYFHVEKDEKRAHEAQRLDLPRDFLVCLVEDDLPLPATREESKDASPPHMTGVQAGGENAVSWQKGIRYMLLHLWLAGAGAGAAFVTVAAFSPRFRQWNLALTRSDVLRKVFVSAAIGGCAGYVVARQLQYIAEEVSDDSRRTIRQVRDVLAEMDKSNFIASYPPLISVSTDRPDDASSAQSSISERIFFLCFHTLTPSPPFYSMRNCLEHDLLERGVSRRDADITITCLASALNRDEWGDFIRFHASRRPPELIGV
ncbi:hypothetical protein DAEQUDRAFT_766306 [Daedalea quercina L-15889]|uniref:Uncharacterized protein n=1 Tax=Daedalea quercina L-15889 TaxID=1314783 RepID=A0A165PQ93_9APHY|nr:hypothetical protein DAEQUDRAFT_766306 [Daedalea quercina L-15889]